jgi:hypothetical protein
VSIWAGPNKTCPPPHLCFGKWDEDCVLYFYVTFSRIYFLHCTISFSFSNVWLTLYRNNILNKGAIYLLDLLLNTTSPLFGSVRLGSSLGSFVPSVTHVSIVATARQTDANPYFNTDGHKPKDTMPLTFHAKPSTFHTSFFQVLW